MTPTRPADRALARRRLAKAEEFWEAAETLAGDPGFMNAYTAQLVLSGIAAADVLCAAKLGLYAPTGDHSEAVALLRRVEPALAGNLSKLLAAKTRAEYSGQLMKTTEMTGLRRAAEALLNAARIA